MQNVANLTIHWLTLAHRKPVHQLPLFRLLLAVALLSLAGNAAAAEIRVAVASNFAAAMRDLAATFEQTSGHRVILATGSTGKHYAQIRNGAPFDLFFAADSERPELLQREGIAAPDSRFTYALGQLVLWSPQAGLVDDAGQVLAGTDFRHIAIANPRLAPYGRAAEQVLRKLGHWDRLRARMVQGENVAQAFQFVFSGNAELGFVALSQIRQPGRPAAGSAWLLAQSLYDPIEQQAVVLKDQPVARAFVSFTRSPRGREIIREHGYQLP